METGSRKENKRWAGMRARAVSGRQERRLRGSQSGVGGRNTRSHGSRTDEWVSIRSGTESIRAKEPERNFRLTA